MRATTNTALNQTSTSIVNRSRGQQTNNARSNIASSMSDTSGQFQENAATQTLANSLQQRAQEDPTAFRQALDQAYGDKADAVELDALATLASSGNLPYPENVRFVDAGTLGLNAMGAYDNANGGTIYLDRRLLNDSEALEAIYTEEMGHHLDAQLGGQDAAGDEGAIFSQSLLQGALNSSELQTLRAENDHGFISIDGQQVAVEFYHGYSGPGSSAATGGSSSSSSSRSSSSSSSSSSGSSSSSSSSSSGSSSSRSSSSGGSSSSSNSSSSGSSSSRSSSSGSSSSRNSSSSSSSSSSSNSSSSRSASSYSGPGSSEGTGGSSSASSTRSSTTSGSSNSSSTRSTPSYSGPGSSEGTGGSSSASSTRSSTTSGSSNSSSTRSTPAYSGPGSSEGTGGSSNSSTTTSRAATGSSNNTNSSRTTATPTFSTSASPYSGPGSSVGTGALPTTPEPEESLRPSFSFDLPGTGNLFERDTVSGGNRSAGMWDFAYSPSQGWVREHDSNQFPSNANTFQYFGGTSDEFRYSNSDSQTHSNDRNFQFGESISTPDFTFGAREEITGGDQSLGGSADYSVFGGRANAGAAATADRNGVALTASGEVFVGSEVNGEVHGELGPVSANLTGRGQAGGSLAGNAGFTLDPHNGLSAEVGIDAFAGVRVSLDAEGELGDSLDASAGVGLRAGVGFVADADIEISPEAIGVDLQLGGSLGFGADVNVPISVSPIGVIDDAGDIIDHIEEFTDEFRDFLNW